MDITIYPRKLSGMVSAIPSKSQAHRLLICAAFSQEPVTILCSATSRDIDATAGCLCALGAQICRTPQGFHVTPISHIPHTAVLCCEESGSTLRFLLPVCAALGVDTVFEMKGRLPERPLSPLWELLQEKGCQLSRPTRNTLRCQGKLQGGNYEIAGNISSQFITGLLFALSLITEESRLAVTGTLESKPYVDMTLQVFSLFGIDASNGIFSGNTLFHSPGSVSVEGDWSNAAFFLAAQALGNSVTVSGLQDDSPQGDREISQLLSQMNDHLTINGKDIPDLIPILAVTAGAKAGAEFVQIGRLRLKESDRIQSTAEMLEALGGSVKTGADFLSICPTSYTGGLVQSHNDHRIAMAAAIASTVSTQPVTILGAQCVEKSYPDFWSEFIRLGGYYEQYIR